MWLDPASRIFVIVSIAACTADEPPDLSGVLANIGSAAGPITDSWGPVFQLESITGDRLAPVHATLLPNKRVLFSGVYRPGPRLGWEALLDPEAVVASPTRLTIMNPPYRQPDRWIGTQLHVQDSLFCSGHSLLADGTVLFAGGSRHIEYFESALHRYTFLYGLDYALRYDPMTNTWDDAGNLSGTSAAGSKLRWYPTVTRLHDGRALVTSGWTYNFIKEYRRLEPDDEWQETAYWGPKNLSIEAGTVPAYPNDATFAQLSSASNTPPQIWNGNYTHAFQLPSAQPSGADIIMLGDYGYPVLFASDTSAFEQRTNPRPGTIPGATSTHEGSTLLLPLRTVERSWGYGNGSILVVGGGSGTLLQRADIYDVTNDSWDPIDTGRNRLHPTTVQLPDGHVAILGGHTNNGSPGVGNVTYLDPANAFAVRTGTTAMPRIRAYHTIALLMPDGRVLVGGGRMGGSVPPEDEAPEIQFLSPWYTQFPQYRPDLVSTPSEIGYNSDFEITFDVSAEGSDLGLGDVVLIGLGSMTHSVDQNQRYIQLVSTRTGTGTATVTGPSDARRAPPGHYMLFVLNQYRLPSSAQIVHLE